MAACGSVLYALAAQLYPLGDWTTISSREPKGEFNERKVRRHSQPHRRWLVSS
jgi:hypothetical protein